MRNVGRCPRCGEELGYDDSTDLWWCTGAECDVVLRREAMRHALRGLVEKRASGVPRGVALSSLEYDTDGIEEQPRRFRKILIGIVVLVLIVALIAMTLAPVLWPQRPSLAVSPTQLLFSDETGTGVMPQALAIQNQGKGRLEWEVATDVPWLILEPSGGNFESDLQIVTVKADITALHEGTHFAMCTVVAAGAHNSPQVIAVRVQIDSPPEARAIRELLGDEVEVFYGVQPPYVSGPTGAPIELINNEDAVDVYWNDLIAFLSLDPTDESPYIQDVHMCGTFAEQLHNNAEAAGIRAAWVSIDLKGQHIGHALNAFFTPDRGLVFVDCTGAQETGILEAAIDSIECDHDKIAYVRPGKEYGLITLDRAESPAYEFYVAYSQAWMDYRQEVEAFNHLASEYNALEAGRSLVTGGEEARYAQRLYRELEAMRVSLEMQQELLGPCRWRSLGIVEQVRIYW